MARFNATGIEGLELSLENVIALPEEVCLEMLRAEGEVIADVQRRKIRELGLVDSGQMLGSITVDKKLRSNRKGLGTIRYINVYPKGARTKKDGAEQTAVHKFKKRRKGKTESIRKVDNAEVAFIHEFGAPDRGIPATQWMREANESAADKAVEAAMKVYDEFLKSKNL